MASVNNRKHWNHCGHIRVCKIEDMMTTIEQYDTTWQPEAPAKVTPRRFRRLGKYRVFHELGAGAMATVYHGFDDSLGRDVAIKVLYRGADQRFVSRFDQEVRVLASLSHPNIPFVVERGHTEEVIPFFVMEYVPGVDLWRLIRQAGPLPVGCVVHVLIQLASALREMHKGGFMHRDVKPSNVMLCMQLGAPDLVKLIDFGLASGLESVNLVAGMRRCGTPGFMAPELFAEDDPIVDYRSDLYGFGAVGHFLLTGHSRTSSDDDVDARRTDLLAYIDSHPAAGLAELLARCLSRNPEQRPRSARAVLAELAALARSSSWEQPFAEAWWWRQAAGYSSANDGDDSIPEMQSSVRASIRPSTCAPAAER